MFDKNLIIGLVVLAVIALAVYSYAPKLRAMLSGKEKFANGGAVGPLKATNGGMGGSAMNKAGPAAKGGAHVAGFESGPVKMGSSSGSPAPSAAAPAPAGKGAAAEGFADYASTGDMMGPVPMAGAGKPQGCYPREQLNPSELLPRDVNSQWAAANPAGAGDIQGKNFLSAGALVGVNTIGQSLRNANRQLRSEPPCPQMKVSPWQQSTIEPDLQRRTLE
jgi:hypothetical protein